MQQTLLTIRYRVSGDAQMFRSDMEKAAALIAGIPGLTWKIWALDARQGTGVSAYLFESTDAAHAFAAGPVVERLRQRADVADVTLDMAPVDQTLSRTTGAERALGLAQAETAC